jgi:hypothetical protein
MFLFSNLDISIGALHAGTSKIRTLTNAEERQAYRWEDLDRRLRRG